MRYAHYANTPQCYLVRIVYLVTVILCKHNIMPRRRGSDCACSTDYRRGSTSRVSRLRNCVSFIQSCLLHVYQLRPELSSPSMMSCLPRLVRKDIIASQRVYFMCIWCVPSRQPHAYELHRKIWVYNVSNNLKVLTQFYYTLLYTQLNAHIHNC